MVFIDWILILQYETLLNQVEERNRLILEKIFVYNHLSYLEKDLENKTKKFG